MTIQLAPPANIQQRRAGRLERFRAKWTPVRVKKTRQNKNLELGSDSIRTENALAGFFSQSLSVGAKTLARCKAVKREVNDL
ncbi:hypothetical protein [Bradyrhizobium nitroreducens]|uniref:hypothetical protein n=1 Tax=Bradyrhizobium nitroreducens TaxID=709803 RepID=UPI001AEFBD33|nr:hypothetical protein [Bradyrhizobium nitroreducens]